MTIIKKILYVTSTTLKKVSDKNVKPVSHLILKISFLTLFGCVVIITLDIKPICPKSRDAFASKNVLYS